MTKSLRWRECWRASPPSRAACQPQPSTNEMEILWQGDKTKRNILDLRGEKWMEEL